MGDIVGVQKGEERLLKASILVLLAIGAGEVVLGYYVRSIALIADGIHSWADMAVSILVFIGIWLTKRSPDKTFRHGYGRAETLFGLVAAFVMVMLGGIIMYESFLAYLSPVEILDPLLGTSVALLAGTISIAVAYLKWQRAKRTGSEALKVDAVNSIKDGSASFVVVAGIALSSAGLLFFDAIAGLIIGAMIIIVGWVSIKESSIVLMDGCLCGERVKVIFDLAQRVPGVRKMHSLKFRKVGRGIFAEATVQLEGGITVSEAHRIVSELKSMIMREDGEITRVTVEIEPHQEGPGHKKG